MDFVYHSTLGLRVINKKRRRCRVTTEMEEWIESAWTQRTPLGPYGRPMLRVLGGS